MNPFRVLRNGLAAGLFVLSSIRSPGAEGAVSVQCAPLQPEVHERVEIVVSGVPAVTNAFDRDAIAVDLEVVAPSGKAWSVPGFYSRDYDRALADGRETLTPRGAAGWRVRWLPLEAGIHRRP